MSSPKDDKPPRLAWGMYKRFALASILIVMLSAGTVASAGLLEIDKLVKIVQEESHTIPGIESALDDVDGGKPQTLLLLGSDRRYVDIAQDLPARSDTMMLVRLDPSQEATAVLSIPRDLKAEIPSKRGTYTAKINAAYSDGGPALAVRTVRQLLGIPIHHVVNVNFGAFQRAVNRLKCVYVDVDRRYFNNNSPPAGGGGPYATIDIQPGYQKLCGSDSLDYVRFRHLDDDLVRAARQQEFLSQAKKQIGFSKIYSDREELVRIFSRYTDTDIHSRDAILRLLRLVLDSSGHPIREVHFRGGVDGEYVTISPENLELTKREFLEAKASKGARPTKPSSKRTTKRPKSSAGLPAGMIDAKRQGEDFVATASTRLSFPLYFPRTRLSLGQYVGDGPHVYTIKDRNGRGHPAYRIVLSTNLNGQYYGVQGTTWRSPPILDDPTDKERMRGPNGGHRTFDVFYDGTRIRLIAWKTPRAVYWVSNTLSGTLTNAQMRAIAKSLTRIGEK